MTIQFSTAVLLTALCSISNVGLCQQDADTKQEFAFRKITRSGEISNFAISPDGEAIAIAEHSGTGQHLSLHDAETGKAIVEHISLLRIGEIMTLNFSKDGRFLIAGKTLKGLLVYSVGEDNSLERHLEIDTDRFSCEPGLARDVPHVALYSSIDQRFQVYNYESGEHVTSFHLGDFKLGLNISIQLSAKGGHALICSSNETLLVDVAEQEVLQYLDDEELYWSCQFNVDATKLIKISDRNVRVQNIRTGEELKRYRIGGRKLQAQTLDSSDELLVLDENQIKVFGKGPIKPILTQKIPGDFSARWEVLKLSPDGSRAVLQNLRPVGGRLLVFDLEQD